MPVRTPAPVPARPRKIDAFVTTGVGVAVCVVITFGVVGDVGTVEARKQDEDKDDCGDCYCDDCARVERVGVPPADDQGWDWRCDEERSRGRG